MFGATEPSVTQGSGSAEPPPMTELVTQSFGSADPPPEPVSLGPSTSPSITGATFAPVGKDARLEGACRTTLGPMGGVYEEWSLVEGACLARCARLSQCLSVELARVGGAYVRCRLYRERATRVVPVDGFRCLAKASNGGPRKLNSSAINISG